MADDGTKEALIAIGKQLRSTRDAMQVSQVQLAKRIRMDPTNLAKIERGTKNVTIDTLMRIAAGLGIELVVKFVAPKRAHRDHV